MGGAQLAKAQTATSSAHLSKHQANLNRGVEPGCRPAAPRVTGTTDNPTPLASVFQGGEMAFLQGQHTIHLRRQDQIVSHYHKSSIQALA